MRKRAVQTGYGYRLESEAVGTLSSHGIFKLGGDLTLGYARTYEAEYMRKGGVGYLLRGADVFNLFFAFHAAELAAKIRLADKPYRRKILMKTLGTGYGDAIAVKAKRGDLFLADKLGKHSGETAFEQIYAHILRKLTCVLQAGCRLIITRIYNQRGFVPVNQHEAVGGKEAAQILHAYFIEKHRSLGSERAHLIVKLSSVHIYFASVSSFLSSSVVYTYFLPQN